MNRNKSFFDNPLAYGIVLWVLILIIFVFQIYKLFLFSQVKNVDDLVSILPTVDRFSMVLLILSTMFVFLWLGSLMLITDRFYWQRSWIPLINTCAIMAVFIMGTVTLMIKFNSADSAFQRIGKQAENYRVTITVKAHDWKQVGKNTFVVKGKTYKIFGDDSLVVNHASDKDKQSIRVIYQSYPKLPKGFNEVKNVYNYGTDEPEYLWPRNQKNNKTIKIEVTE